MNPALSIIEKNRSSPNTFVSIPKLNDADMRYSFSDDDNGKVIHLHHGRTTFKFRVDGEADPEFKVPIPVTRLSDLHSIPDSSVIKGGRAKVHSSSPTSMRLTLTDDDGGSNELSLSEGENGWELKVLPNSDVSVAKAIRSIAESPVQKQAREMRPTYLRILRDRVMREREKVNTSPSKAQIEAGNYRMGHAFVHGLDITIESPKGSTRSGVDNKGNKWSVTMKNDYGYIRNHPRSAADGDHVDVFIGPHPSSELVFVIDQYIDGKFDEHKCMLGFLDKRSAKKAYIDNFDDKWKGFGSITALTVDQFKKWIRIGDTSKPLSGQSYTSFLKRAMIEYPAPVQAVINSPIVSSVPVSIMSGALRGALFGGAFNFLNKLKDKKDGKKEPIHDNLVRDIVAGTLGGIGSGLVIHSAPGIINDVDDFIKSKRAALSSRISQLQNAFDKEVSAGHLPPDVGFFCNSSKCELSVGDWHEKETCDRAKKLAEKFFDEVIYEDSEVGRPEWCTSYITPSKEASKLFKERVKLAESGSCCGSKCKGCPFKDKHSEGCSEISPEMAPEIHELKGKVNKDSTIAFDLDGTLFTEYDGEFAPDKFGKPIKERIQAAKDLKSKGYKVVVFTARASEESNIPYVKKILESVGLKGVEVTNEKTPDMKAFVDDRAIEASHSAAIDEKSIAEFVQKRSSLGEVLFAPLAQQGIQSHILGATYGAIGGAAKNTGRSIKRFFTGDKTDEDKELSFDILDGAAQGLDMTMRSSLMGRNLPNSPNQKYILKV